MTEYAPPEYPREDECPKCGALYMGFRNDVYTSWWRRFLRLPCVAVVCRNCHKVVRWEMQ